VIEYHTLASIAGAPQIAFALASSASVVASLVSAVVLNGTELIGAAPPNVSFVGAAACAGAAATRTKPAARTTAPTRLKSLNRTYFSLPCVAGHHRYPAVACPVQAFNQ
jgi:hypothetical protein